MEVDGVGEDQRRRGAAVHRADDDGLCLDGDIRYRVVFPRGAAQGEPGGRVGVGLPVVAFLVRLAHAVQHLVIREIVEDGVHLLPAELLSGMEGQLEGGALDMAHLYIWIAGVDAGPLRRRAVKPFGTRGEELVERVRRGDHYRGGDRAAPSRAPDLLPGGGDASGVAVQHGEGEGADVDAEFERVRADDAAQPAAAQVVLDPAAFLRQIAAAVAHDHHRVRAALGEVGADRFEQQLHIEARAREDDRADAGGKRLGGDA